MGNHKVSQRTISVLSIAHDSWRIKSPPRIDHDDQLFFLTRLPRGIPGQARGAVSFVAEPFDERPAAKTTLQQTIEGRTARSHAGFAAIGLPGRDLLLQFLLQNLNELLPRRQHC